MLANPAANATVANETSVVSISRRAVCARWARAKRERTGAELTGQRPVEVSLADGEPPGDAADAFAIHEPVGDQSHRAPDEVPPYVPLRRARRGVRPAATTRPEPGPLSRRGARVEPHVAAVGSPGRAARPAVDVGRRHGDVEPSVEPAVTTLHCAVAPLFVFDHHDDHRPSGGSRASGNRTRRCRRCKHVRPAALGLGFALRREERAQSWSSGSSTGCTCRSR